MRYSGPSMYPTLKPMDRLEMIQTDEVRPGDVVVFLAPGTDRKLAHRVLSVTSDGITTQGDGNCGPDEWLLSAGQILGVVTYAWRGKRRIRIHGGRRGRALASILRLGLMVRLLMFKGRTRTAVRSAYLRLARKGILNRWLSPIIRTRVVSLKRPAGTELQLLLGSRVIGSLPPGQSEWKIRPPYRLLIDEASLPTPDTEGLQG